MGVKRFRDLLCSDGLTVGLWSCDLANLTDGPEQHTDVATLNIPLRGSFFRRGPAGAELVDPLTCSFSAVGDAWCTRHLSPCRDTGVYVRLDERHLAAPFGTTFKRLSPREWLDWRVLVASLAHRTTADAADATWLLVERVLGAPPTATCTELARDARARLAPGDVRSVDALAAELGVSVFVLCRGFRRSTGTTVHAWLDRIRAARAADAIAAGATDLGALALDLGFSHHSHLTSRMRHVFGCTPTGLRARIAGAARI